ncbi:MAG TPA: hypothetical protein VGK72_12705 [Chthoniobacterales bacterium]
MRPILALLAALSLAVAPTYAGTSCSAMSGNKADCSKMFAEMKLTPKQKARLDAAQRECNKAGCTKQSMDKFMHTAKGVLTAQQYAELEAKCQQCMQTKS